MISSAILWTLTSALFSQGLSLLIGILVARSLGKNDYGAYSLVIQTVTSLAALSSVSMGYTATRFVSEFWTQNNKEAQKFSSECSQIANAASIAGTILLVLLAPSLVLIQNSSLVWSIWLASPCVYLISKSSLYQGLHAGTSNFRRIATANIYAGAIGAVATYPITSLLSLPGAIIAVLLTNGLRNVILRESLPAELRTIKSSEKETRLEVLRFAVPGSLSSATAIPAALAPTILLASLAGGESEVARHAVGLAFYSIVYFLPAIINSALMPILNKTSTSKGKKELQKYIRLNILGTTLAASLVAYALALGAKWLLPIWGDAFSDCAQLVVLYVLAATADALVTSANQHLQVDKKMWAALVFVNLPRDTVIIALSILFRHIGAEGAALAILIGRILAIPGVMFAIASKASTPQK